MNVKFTGEKIAEGYTFDLGFRIDISSVFWEYLGEGFLTPTTRPVQTGSPNPNQISNMKHTLLLSALALVGATSVVAGPSDAAAFAMRAAQSQPTQAVANSEVKYTATNHTKGGSTLAQTRDNEATSIALMKSNKGDSCSSCNSGSCKAR